MSTDTGFVRTTEYSTTKQISVIKDLEQLILSGEARLISYMIEVDLVTVWLYTGKEERNEQ